MRRVKTNWNSLSAADAVARPWGRQSFQSGSAIRRGGRALATWSTPPGSRPSISIPLQVLAYVLSGQLVAIDSNGRVKLRSAPDDKGRVLPAEATGEVDATVSRHRLLDHLRGTAGQGHDRVERHCVHDQYDFESAAAACWAG